MVRRDSAASRMDSSQAEQNWPDTCGTIHAKLAERAKVEGVSLNTLVLAFIAEGLGRNDAMLR